MNIKTKLTAIITALIMALTLMPQFTLSTAAAGNVYRADISTADELKSFRDFYNSDAALSYDTFEITLTNDIDMTRVCSNGTWEPIGKTERSFSGTFDGGGHTITGFYLRDYGESPCVGLFGNARGGTVKNLNVCGDIYVNSRSASMRYVGGIGGMVGTLENCSFTGDVYCSGYDCFVGGLAGFGKINNSYNTGKVFGGNGSNVGGLAGIGIVRNSYNTGAVSGGSGSTVSGLVGIGGSVSNCYYLSSSGGGAGKTAEQFASGEVTYLLQSGQSSQIWGQKIGTDAYPVFTDDAGKTVYKAAFMYNGGKSEYAVQYQNAGGKFTVPTGEPSQEFIFQYWTADIEGNTEYTGTDNVSEDITVYAVGIAKYGESSIGRLISTTYGDFNEQTNLQDLSTFIAYGGGISTADKFNYSILKIYKDGRKFNNTKCIFIAPNTSGLFVMPNTPAGTYTITIEATEKEPVISLMSAYYDATPVTFTITVTVNKADPEYEIPKNLSADFGQILSDIELPEGFAWADGTQRLEIAGVNTFEAIYTPEDTENYNVISVSVAVMVNPITEEAPEVEIDYENETITGLVPNAFYIINNTDAEATAEGTLSIQKYIGQTISLAKKASDENHADSEKVSLTLPARQAVPKADVFEVTQPSEIIGIIGAIGGITEDMEYSTDYGVTWIDGTGEEISGIESASVYIVRYSAGENKFKSNPYVIAINAIEPEQEPTPEIGIDYENELLTGFDPDGVYLINGELFTTEGNGNITENMPIKDEYIGQILSIVRIGWIDSEAQLLAVPARPEMPAGDDFEVSQQPDEAAAALEEGVQLFAVQTASISGITADMEYSTDYGKTWKDGTGEKIENIAGGTTYSVRVKATNGSFKSMSNVISINAGNYEQEPTPEIGIDYENELLTGFDPDGVYLINGKLLTSEDGGSITENMPLNGEYIGQTISIVRIGRINSEPQLLKIPLRPNAPEESDFNVTRPSEIMGLKGAIGGITADMEYSTDYGMTWIDGADAEIENIESGTTFSIRKKATNNSFRSMTYVISVINAEAKQEEAPEISVDYENKSLVGFDPDGVYLINGELFTAEGDGNITEKMPIKDEYFGQTISIIRMGMVNSEPQLLAVDDCPAMTPVFAVNQTKMGAADGKITGVDETMEYKAVNGEWTDVQGEEITGLESGTYTVRIKATKNSFASDIASAVVGTDTALVIFTDSNGHVLQAEQLEKGIMPEYNGTIPSREQDDIYSYEFSGWSPELAEVSEDVVYEAQYVSNLRKCSVEYADGKAFVYVPENTDCAVVFAAYDADGALTNIKIETTILGPGTSIVTPRGFDMEGAASVTVMLWDSLEGMMPLCRSNKVQLQ